MKFIIQVMLALVAIISAGIGTIFGWELVLEGRIFESTVCGTFAGGLAIFCVWFIVNLGD